MPLVSQENLQLQGTLHWKMVNTSPAVPKRQGRGQRGSCSLTSGLFLLSSSDLSLTILFFSLFNLIHPNFQNTNKTGHFSPFLHLPLHQDYVSLSLAWTTTAAFLMAFLLHSTLLNVPLSAVILILLILSFFFFFF